MEWFSPFYIAGGDAVHFRILMNKMSVMTLVAPDTRTDPGRRNGDGFVFAFQDGMVGNDASIYRDIVNFGRTHAKQWGEKLVL